MWPIPTRVNDLLSPQEDNRARRNPLLHDMRMIFMEILTG
jgi:hypothetical protein